MLDLLKSGKCKLLVIDCDERPRSGSRDSSASLGMTGKERRNARSTLERRILVSVGDTHVQRRIPKERNGNALGPVARRVLREGTARPRFSGNGGTCER